MSAKSAVPPNTLVTVKVTFNDNTRRFKLALKDLGAAVLPGKLRGLLGIASGQEILFERYSDSSSSWVALDASNPSVYKQLYRAAKAKLKLRIKATVATVTIAQPLVPAHTEGAAPLTTVQMVSQAARAQQPFSDEGFAASSATLVPVAPEQLDEVVAKAVNTYCSSDDFTSQLRGTVREEVEKHASEPSASMPDLLSLPRGESTSDISVNTLAAQTTLLNISQMNELDAQPVEHDIVKVEVYCNGCHKSITGYHYHCDKCDGGDFDLCQSCTNSGQHCHDNKHWLSRRLLGVSAKPEKYIKRVPTRICNNCVREDNHYEFVHCWNCRDFDLCLKCHREQKHGHDPRHSFAPAAPDAELSAIDKKYLPAGRGVVHSAFCDKCDERITGIRHKCIDCPNWDYCSNCIGLSAKEHPGHRFVPVFDDGTVTPLYTLGSLAMAKHTNIYCDGPICRTAPVECIRGARYKCAVCEDTDFCAACEASPLNTHNPTHPLIKIKTPIRNVHCQTIEEGNGVHMGDSAPAVPTFAKTSAATSNAATQVQTVADTKPTEEFATPAPEPESKPAPEPKPAPLAATYVEDKIRDGTVFLVGQEFTQSWTLKNTGTTSWPAGVTCTFVGGAGMFLNFYECHLATTEKEVAPGETHTFTVDLSTPLRANKNYVSYWRLMAPDGTRFGDNLWCSICAKEAEEPAERKGEDEESNVNDVLYSASSMADTESIRGGDDETVVSEVPRVHERDLLDHAGDRFGPQVMPSPEEVAKAREWIQNMNAANTEAPAESEKENSTTSECSSQMIFPKLPVESPIHSVETLRSSSETFTANEEPEPISIASSNKASSVGSAEHVFSDVDVSSVGDDDSFLTDEEYDVLDASDEDDFETVA